MTRTREAGTRHEQTAPRGYERLKTFVTQAMTMSHVYQPLMLRTILAGGGAATRRQIAAAFLAADLSQLEYYEQITKGYPTQTLKRHGIISHERGVYRLAQDLDGLDEWERASLMAVCDAKLAEYVAQRQSAIWRHRAQNFEPIEGTLRYKVIVRAKGRCEACGVSNQERALQVDHITPRTQGGSNDLWNLQALCSTCNAQKLDRDRTDFHRAHADYDQREPRCAHCAVHRGSRIQSNALAAVDADGEGAFVVYPLRHVASWFELTQPEVNAIRSLELWAAAQSQTRLDVTIAAVPVAGHCLSRLAPAGQASALG